MPNGRTVLAARAGLPDSRQVMRQSGHFVSSPPESLGDEAVATVRSEMYDANHRC